MLFVSGQKVGALAQRACEWPIMTDGILTADRRFRGKADVLVVTSTACRLTILLLSCVIPPVRTDARRAVGGVCEKCLVEYVELVE